MGQPAVSVLLPVRDAAPFLEECLKSLARQTLGDFEVVAVDDGSRDGSHEILERWATRDRRFRVTRRPARGLVETLNAGLELCRGDLVARLDADDRALPRRVELQAARLAREPELDVVSCLVRHFPEAGVGRGLRVYERWLNGLVDHGQILRDRFVESPIPHPSATVRRRVLVEAGGYRDLGWPEDYDLWLRLAAAGKRFAKVPEVLQLWRDHPHRLTRTDRRYAVDRFLACKAHYLVRGPLAGSGRIIIWGAGQTGRRLSKHLLAEGAPVSAFIDVDPKKIGRTARARPIHPPEELPELVAGDASARILAAVPSRGARKIIRGHLDALGLHETQHYWCVA